MSLFDQFRALLDGADAQLSSLTTALASSKNDTLSLRSMLDTSTAEVTRLNKLVADLTKADTADKAALDSANKQINDLRAQVADLQAQLGSPVVPDPIPTPDPVPTPIPDPTPKPTPIPTLPRTLFGAAVGSNSDPSDLETRIGANLGVHRTYFGTSIGSAATIIKQDLAKGRTPVISFHFPFTWKEMATGTGDAWAKDLLSRVATAANGALVYFVIDHEPEGDQAGTGEMGLDDWAAAQARVYSLPRPTNIRHTLVFTGFHWNPTAKGKTASSLDKLFPKSVPADVVAFDCYNYFGAYATMAEFVAQSGTKTTKWMELTSYVDVLSTFAKAKGKEWGVAETGFTTDAGTRDMSWLSRSYNYCNTKGGCDFLSYFCSQIKSRGDWDIRNTARETEFKKTLLASKS